MRFGKNIKLHSLRSSDELLKILRHEEDFLDVTLCCEGAQESNLEAHKVILALSSSVFKEMLSANKPFQSNGILTIYLRGVHYEDLSLLLDFIYQGEVSVPKQQISSFIALAEDLKIHGLFKGNNTKEELYINSNGELGLGPIKPMRESKTELVVPKREPRFSHPPFEDVYDKESDSEEDADTTEMSDSMINSNKDEDEPTEEGEDDQGKIVRPEKTDTEEFKKVPIKIKSRYLVKCQGQIMTSNKGKKVLLVNGFRYTYKRIAKKQRAMAWRCYRKNPPTRCAAVIKTNILNFNDTHVDLDLYQGEEHNHLVDNFQAKSVDKSRFLKRISYKVSTSPFLSPKQIYDECLSHITDEDLQNIPTFKSIKETIRKKIERVVKQRNSIYPLQLPDMNYQRVEI